MNRYQNVVPFPKKKIASDSSVKLFLILFYCVLAYILSVVFRLSESGLTLLIVLGLVYNFFVRNRFNGQYYLRQNAVLLAILAVLFIFAFQNTMLWVLGIVGAYWFLVARKQTDSPYFLKFHILTALITSFFILMPYLIAVPSILAMMQLFSLLGLQSFSSQVFGVFQYLSVVPTALFFAMAGWFSVAVIQGKTPELKIITENVRYWV
ncbi:MAG: hypothetical protein AAGI66_09900 [Cyanobacteria bacterium P01_H01_bin.74]